MMTNKNLLFFLLFIALPPAWAEQAEQRWYKVELVAFSYLSQIGMGQERWPAQPEPLDLSAAVELTERGKSRPGQGQPAISVVNPVAFQRLPNNELTLKADATAISRSKGRHLLLHTAWLQPALERQQALAVHLRGKEIFSPVPAPGSAFVDQDDFQRGDLVPTNSPPLAATPASDAPAAPGKEPAVAEAPQVYLRVPPNKQRDRNRRGRTGSGQPSIGDTSAVPGPESDVNILDGSFTVSIGRYLHVWIDLMYREPIAISPESNREYREFILAPYRISMHRRMRSNELHYIDHPLVGMLVKITRHEFQKNDKKNEFQGTDLPIATDAIPAQ